MNNKNFNYTFQIVTTICEIKIAKSLDIMLKSLGYNSNIQFDQITLNQITLNLTRPTEYFILLLNSDMRILNIPFYKKYIIYQLTQLETNLRNDKIFSMISESLFTMDYSKANIEFYPDEFLKSILYLPLPISKIVEKKIIFSKCKYDILFLGTITDRRKKILNNLISRYKSQIHIKTNIFGPELFEIIKKSKIIINIHEYSNSLLETSRINEVIVFDKIIISELGSKKDIESNLLYNDKIIFCEEINDELTNIVNLYEKIDYYLNKLNYNKKISNNNINIEKLYSNSVEYLNKILVNNLKIINTLDILNYLIKIIDWKQYIYNYPDLQKGGINSQTTAIMHWHLYGKNENRTFEKLAINKIDKDNSIKILTTLTLLTGALMLQKQLTKLNISSKIIFNLVKDVKNDNTLYIIIINMSQDDNMPPNYIFWQIEQTQISSDIGIKKFDNVYFNRMNNSLLIYEMSIKNYKQYKQNILNKKKLHYNQLPFCELNKINISEKKYDIIFFGTQNKRRIEILKLLEQKLKNKYIIKTLFGIINDERDKYLNVSKYLINLHYYDNPSLEIDRINIGINSNCFILSEDVNNDDTNKLRYTNFIKFFPIIDENYSNIDDVIKIIEYNLEENIYKENIKNFDINKKKLENDSLFYLHKTLYITNKLNISVNIHYDLLDHLPVCLTLLEDDNRYIKLKSQENYLNHQIFPAIKHNICWIGCALSYYTIIFNAQRLNFKNITIFEDDCKFDNNSEQNYQIIKEFLDKISAWDIFNGYIYQISDDVIINNIYSYKGITFLEITKMVGTVFNIYNKTIYNNILKWNVNDNVINNNHIDRYINDLNPKIITVFPYIFNILEVESSLNMHNNKYEPLFEYKWFKTEENKTIKIINEKINNFYKNNTIKIIE